MPWRETSPVNVSELCRRFGISCKTGYKWLERFYCDGADEEALRDRSRWPHSHPKAVPTWLEEAIVHRRATVGADKAYEPSDGTTERTCFRPSHPLNRLQQPGGRPSSVAA